jgi:hypothetical protein
MKKFLSLDWHGEQVGINFRGSSTYNTLPGAIISLVSLTILMYYSVQKAIIFFGRSDPDLVYNVV